MPDYRDNNAVAVAATEKLMTRQHMLEAAGDLRRRRSFIAAQPPSVERDQALDHLHNAINILDGDTKL